MPTEGPLTESGLEVWRRGICDLGTQISREYDHPVIEITESGCGYLDAPYEKRMGVFPIRGDSSGSVRNLQNWRAP